MMRRLSRTAILLVVLVACLAAGSRALAQDVGQGAEDCWSCHRLPNLNGIEGSRALIAFCQDCHADKLVDTWAASERSALYVDPSDLSATIHSGMACIACHTGVARNPHQSGEAIACADCHATLLTHVNMGAPHVSTDCAACHRAELPVAQDRSTGQVMLASTSDSGAHLDRTDHAIASAPECAKCHVSGNKVGAPAITLPARSILCMVCHDASPTVSIGLFHPAPVQTDYASLIGLLILSVGLVLNVSFYLGGHIPGRPGLTATEKLSHVAGGLTRLVFSRRVLQFAGGLIADGILLRRVLQESVGRWVAHQLIYLPFLGRFALGLITWLGMALWPSAPWVQTLADKNTPGVAFAYDLLTALMLLGVLLVLFRRFVLRDRRLVTFSQDRIAIALLGAIVLVGILTEGLRILSAGTPPYLAVYSFLGYATAIVLSPLRLDWTVVYPAIWYVHGVLAIAFIAYLPFSKFMHVLAAPLIASLDSARKGRH